MQRIERTAMLGLWALGLLALSGCRSAEARHPRSPASARSTPTPAAPAAADTNGPAFSDTLLTLDSAAVVLFWLPAVDTLDTGSREEAAAELKATAGWAGDYLASYDIPLHATHAHGVLVRPAGGSRRFIDFRGLDYPFGFVLIEPGYPERFLTGLVTEDDLRDELVDYFDLEQDDSASVMQTGWPVPAGPRRVAPARRLRHGHLPEVLLASAPEARRRHRR
ncbi:MAG TPA: hypothetical protein VJN95_15005 [Gemmatimonadales bacterium]|nr:hypothetical protein [Gemmatimonadales bacterium]